MLNTANQARMQSFDRPGQFDLLNAREQIFVGDFKFEASEMGAEAKVLTDSVSEVPIWIAIDPEFERILKDFLIPIR